MLLIGLTSLLIAIPLYSSTITPTLLTRITSIILLFSAALSFNSLYMQAIGSGLGLYSGLFHVTTVTQFMEMFLYVIGAFILQGWSAHVRYLGSSRDASENYIGAKNDTLTPKIAEYSLIILFTTIGASFLISSADLVSMYLSIELQSFAVYILAAIYRNSESATSAGLKYFLLGALSSALILLGSSLIYAYTGLTQFENIYMITSVFSSATEGMIIPGNLNESTVILGILIIAVGFLFKVAAAPFHSWAPDVYDGVPTIVTTWLTVMPKISIFIFLLQLQVTLVTVPGVIEQMFSLSFSENQINFNLWKNLLLTTSLLSLVIGTIVGLAQYRLKRLLAFSTISHVGFLLLALSVNSEEAITSFLFYLMQYSVTNLNTFFVILAFGYIISSLSFFSSAKKTSDLSYISQLKGQFYANPILGLSLAVCLFSMAGIPPLMGFLAKYMVLYSAIENGYYFLALVGILASVISAAYYLRIIRVIHFDNDSVVLNENYQVFNDLRSLKSSDEKVASLKSSLISSSTVPLTSVHSYIIAVLTLFILLFLLSPSLLLNSSNLLALSLFTA